ncbi:ATP-binding cassette domain-containing protein [Campylobacter sp. faydin G-105]|uniref:iron ABC transporter ATP-binding protein n=1 Tax=Campylobacter anatolicus TaxID=2829105 RepID=UPI001B9683F3|nr:ATP-binding cassette domain-containing protein [Campylobacter anatolicus]MBR8461347.1 ATP-binding cassette domain-containing protein [Campylobacter anatolicus]
MQVKNLIKIYGDTNVVDNVSFEIKRGKVTSFIGPNGAGKSTIMHIISRLIQKDSGEVIFGGKNLSDYKSKDLAKHLAILTQSNNIAMKLSVRELVSFGRFPYSGSKLDENDVKIVDDALEKMQLTKFAERYLDELSGGQRQRAFIAMIIAQDTEFVLLDEPTNNLDIYHSIQMMKNVKFLSQTLGKTIIMVLHELNLATFYSDYICAFKDGKVVKYGEVNDVMTKENLSEIYNVDFEILNIHDKPLSIYF